MQVIEKQTSIRAPIDLCFQLSLDIDLEMEAARSSSIEAIAGVTSGQIGLGERVTWKTRQFGISVRHTSEITQYDRPSHFRDEMVDGIFAVFAHDHYFREDPDGTSMKDVLRFSMPLWLMGRVSEALFVRRRLSTLLLQRNDVLKKTAEMRAAH